VKPRLRRLENRLTGLEAARAAAAIDPEADRKAYTRFSDLGWWLVHPDVVGEVAELRPKLWPWWHLCECQVSALSVPPFGPYWRDARPLADAADEWIGGDPDDDDVWQPLNCVSVHWLKLLWRRHGLTSYRRPLPGTVSTETFPNGTPKPAWRPSGADEAEPIDEFFPGEFRPWSRGFDPDPAAWPEGLRLKVRRSLSVWPEWPDPPGEFEWGTIPRSFTGAANQEWPYPRGDDGRPIRGRLQGSWCDP
jgi:hypothetical protein